MNNVERKGSELSEKRAQEIVFAVGGASYDISQRLRRERVKRDKSRGRFDNVPQKTKFRGMADPGEGKESILNMDTPESIRALILEACDVLMNRDLESLTLDQNRAHTLEVWVRKRAVLLKDLGEVLHEFGFESQDYYGEGHRMKFAIGNIYAIPARLTKYWKNFDGVIHAIFRGFNDRGKPYFEFDRTLLGKSESDLLKEDVFYERSVVKEKSAEGRCFAANFQFERRMVGFTLTGEEVYEILSKRQITPAVQQSSSSYWHYVQPVDAFNKFSYVQF